MAQWESDSERDSLVIVLIVPVAASLLLSLFRGGRFERLGEVRIKGFYLILLTLVLQVLLFNPFWSDAAVWSESLYILTTLPLVVATWLNRRVLGVIPVALGLLMLLTLNPQPKTDDE